MQLCMPATATAGLGELLVGRLGGLELADEPGDLTGGDAGADGEAADLLDDGGRCWPCASARAASMAASSARRLRLLGERDDRRDEVFGAIGIRAEAGHEPRYRDALSSQGAGESQEAVKLRTRGQGRARSRTHSSSAARPSSRAVARREAELGAGARRCRRRCRARRPTRARGGGRRAGARRARERLQRAVEAHAVAAADVVDAAGRGVRLRRRRGWRRRCRPRT